MLPNTLYVGPDKAGSTWIWQALRAHPDVIACAEKDLYFFDRYYGRGLGWYSKHFPTSDARVVLEVCHDYLYSDVAAQRMAADLPGVRVFVNLRHPIERLVSGYQNMVRNGETSASLEATLEAVPELLERSLYARHLAPYLDLLGHERVGIFDFGDLERDAQQFFDCVCDWLGIERLPLSQKLLVPARVAQSPRSRLAARGVRQVAALVRRAGAPAVVGAVKHSALADRLLYRPLGRDDRPEVSSALDAQLRAALAPDVRELARLTGIDFMRRWRFS